MALLLCYKKLKNSKFSTRLEAVSFECEFYKVQFSFERNLVLFGHFSFEEENKRNFFLALCIRLEYSYIYTSTNASLYDSCNMTINRHLISGFAVKCDFPAISKPDVVKDLSCITLRAVTTV